MMILMMMMMMLMMMYAMLSLLSLLCATTVAKIAPTGTDGATTVAKIAPTGTDGATTVALIAPIGTDGATTVALIAPTGTDGATTVALIASLTGKLKFGLVFFSKTNVGVEKDGNADEDEDSDNDAVVAVDDSAVVAVDGGAVVAVADSAISSSKTFQYSASVALAACFPGRDVGAGYFLHSSPISAKMSSDVEGVDEGDVDEDVAFATVVDSFNPQYISSSSMRAETDLNSVLLLAMILLSVWI